MRKQWEKIVIALALIGGAAAAVSAAPPSGPKFSEDNALYHFEYGYPAAAQAIPKLKAWLDADRAKQRTQLISDAREGRDAAKEGDYDYNPFDVSVQWSVVSNLPGWLSLSGSGYAFTGGAHGNSWSAGLVWDKAAGQSRAATDLFVSKAAFNAALRQPFCDALDKERSARREQPVNRNSGDVFDECIAPAEGTVLLGSADKAHFTRIGIILDPYAAGPYVEGSYEVTLPVTAAVLRAVKPEYRAAFALGR